MTDDDGAASANSDPELLLGAAEPADEPVPPALVAEWALWGREEKQTGAHVLRYSKGALDVDDFRHVITRYAPGARTADLPHYTICWIPAARDRPAYLAVAIHELADRDPYRSGGRPRHVDGRVIEYVRLFCVRYDDLADQRVSYSELVRAVEGSHQLVSGTSDPIRLELSSLSAPGAIEGAGRALAMNVAALLLTSRPVCVLGADHIPAADRLAFFDQVLSLLPFGMRATLSASTWASSTARSLKLRLYFANARRDDDRTTYVSWGQSADVDIRREPDEAAAMYLDWLQTASPGAIGNMADMTGPVRFAEAEIRAMIAALPVDKSVADTLADLAGSLRHRDQPAVAEQTKRLRRFLASPRQPGDRALFRSLIARYGLFADHEGVHRSVKRSLYALLLESAYEDPLSYADYCEIEDAAAGGPSRTLRQVLLERRLNVLSFVIAATAGQGVSERELMDALDQQAWRPGNLLGLLDREMDVVRPRHRMILFDFGLQYLTDRAADARRDLVASGYLSGLLARAFPGDQRAQQSRLEAILQFVYGDQLSRGQIKEVLEQPRLEQNGAVEAAVANLTASWPGRSSRRRRPADE